MGKNSSGNNNKLEMFVILFFALFGLSGKVCGAQITTASPIVDCHSTHFECANKVCVKPDLHCNGIDDCGDNSDEVGCGVKTLLKAPKSCPSDSYLCTSPAMCVTKDELCGDFNQCNDFDAIDRLCPFKCQPKKFKCHNVTQCIEKKHTCDGRKDCEDGSDELGCDDEKFQCRTDPDSFMCDDLECLFADSVCDGHNDCTDGSDEKHDCHAQCKAKKCGENMLCRPAGRGVECVCHDGYEMGQDGLCKDKAYCKASDVDRPCSQICSERPASKPSCRCVSGYRLNVDGKSCKAIGDEAVIYVATATAIHAWSVQSKTYTKVIDGLNAVTALAVDSAGKRLFWAEMGEDQPEVFSLSLNDGAQTKEVVISFGLQKPVDLAYDFMGKNLYIVDAGSTPSITVCELHQKNCVPVFNSSVVSAPRNIVLNPAQGVLYYTETGANGGIMKGSMDGSSSEVFVSVNTHRPQSLEIDLSTGRLYWVEGMHQHLFKVDLDGKNKKPVLGYKVKSPSMVAMFEDSVFWISDKSNDVMEANKFTGNGARSVFKVIHKPTAMAIGQEGLQVYDGINRCNGNRCQLCLLNSRGTGSCFCRRGYKASDSKTFCEKNRAPSFLFASDMNRILRLDLNTTGRPVASFLQNKKMKSIFSLAFLPKANVLVYSDISSNYGSIIKMGLSNISRTQEIASNLKGVSSIAVDEGSQIVFWTDTAMNAIKVASLSGTYQVKLPVKTTTPYAMAINAVRGTLYFSELPSATKSAVIKKCRLDGYSCKSHISERLQRPTYLLADGQKLYWSDAGLGEISAIDEWGNERHKLVVTGGKPLSFAIDSNILYWTEQGESSVFYKHIHKEGGFESKIKIQGHTLTGLIAVVPNEVMESACSHQNGGCGHICISIKRTAQASCLCAEGFKLGEDGKRCVRLQAEECDGFLCLNDGSCIDVDKKCDNYADCSDGSDEDMDVCVEDLSCAEGEFQCGSQECIDNRLVCDGDNDCNDNSDELSTHCAAECNEEDFRCDTNRCIDNESRCDRIPDCNDGADEVFCDNEKCHVEEFTCRDNSCIPKDWVCDGGEPDCPEGEDEKNCQPKYCGSEEFKCNDDSCIGKSEVCDKFKDCSEGEDEEESCDEKQPGCSDDQFECYNGECITKSALCDGTEDCSGREDERMCGNRCSVNEFTCGSSSGSNNASLSCIAMSKRCDGVRNCPDGLDEKDCVSSSLVSTTKTKELAAAGGGSSSAVVDILVPNSPKCDGFSCGLGNCVKSSERCDGKADCRDNTDELNCRLTCETAKKRCGQICLDTFNGIQCGCEPGFKLMDDGYACQDIDECQSLNGGCSHRCINVKGQAHNGRGFKCICNSGFVQGRDHFSCKANGKRPELYIATPKAVKKVSFERGIHESVLVSMPLINFNRLDVDVKRDILYWSDSNTFTSEMNLYRQSKRSGRKQVLFTGSIVDLAVDWISGNVYVMHGAADSVDISAIASNGLSKRLVTVMKCAPTLVLHPKRGEMFWVAIKPHASIVKADMDGSYPQGMAKATRHVHNEVSILSIDETTERLYWVHPIFGQLKSMSVVDHNQDVFTYDLATNGRQFVSMDIFEGIAYLTSPDENTIQSFSTANKGKAGLISLGRVSHPGRVRIHHTMKQPLEYNACGIKKCMYMCIVTKRGAMCVCPDKYATANLGNCEGPPAEMLHPNFPKTLGLPKEVFDSVEKTIQKFNNQHHLIQTPRKKTTPATLKTAHEKNGINNNNDAQHPVVVIDETNLRPALMNRQPQNENRNAKENVTPHEDEHHAVNEDKWDNSYDTTSSASLSYPPGCGSGCHNKGVCIRSVTNTQHCRCAKGFEGQFCEMKNQKLNPESKKTSDEKEEGGSLTWLVGVFIGLIALAVVIVGGICYLRYQRRGDTLTSSIRFKKQKQFVICNQDDKDSLVPEISINNPGFQDEVDEEAHMQQNQEQEWWKKLISRSRRSVDSAFHSKNGSDEGIDGYLKGDFHDLGMSSDKVRLL